MHSSTKTWKSSRTKQKEVAARKHRARVQTCPNSPFFTEHFNFQQHETMMKKEKELLLEKQISTGAHAAPVSVEPFGGKVFAHSAFAVFDPDFSYSDFHPVLPEPQNKRMGRYLYAYSSPVLCKPTIWQNEWVVNKCMIWPAEPERNTQFIAPFPAVPELKFEGPERISTSEDHLRCFPHPRESRNDTVSWSRRPYLKPHEFDALSEHHFPTEEDVLFAQFEVGLPNDEDLNQPLDDRTQSESTSDTNDDPYEGVKATRLLGNDLLDAMDPHNVYF